MMSFALCEILFKRDGTFRLDKLREHHAHHGLELSFANPAGLKGEVKLDALSVRKASRGTFPVWHETARHPPLIGKSKEIHGSVQTTGPRALTGGAPCDLFEFEPATWLTNDDFFDSMDAFTQIESDLAAVLCSAWSRFCEQVIHHGNLVDFCNAWADPVCPPGLWAAAAEELIAHELPNYSLLTIKAYPLEYEGRVPARSAARTGLMSRQRAMIRYYQRLFGVQKFPGRSGDEGWLYRINPITERAMERPRNRR
jgi:hypothetical protein